jgi:hypothetical protein
MDMFLNPGLLAGVGMAAVPVVLHLIMRQKPRHLEFPALRFIRSKHETNRRQMRLRHWLLLLLRAGAICLLATALARPTIDAAGLIGDREGPVAAAMIFDTQPHMGYRHENKTRLEAAQETAQWLLAQLPEDSQIGVLDSEADSPIFQIDRGAAKQRITRLETSGVGQPLWKSLDSAVDLLKTSSHRKEIYLFTDMARSAWSGESASGNGAAQLQQRLRSLRGVGIYLIDVSIDKPQNFGLGEVRLSGQLLAKNTPVSISTELASVGTSGQRQIESYVLDSTGQPEKRSQETVTVSDGKPASVEVFLGGFEQGTHQGYLKLVGGDGLAADDQRFFTIDICAAWKVLVVANKPAEEQAFFFTEALAPKSFRKNGQARFQCEVVSFDKLAEQALDNYAAVCLLDPPALADPTWQQLSTYALGGGGVAIFLGEHASKTDFDKPAAQELLPGTLASQARFPDGDIYLAPGDSQHPLLAKFKPLRGSIAWEAYPVYRYWQLDKLASGVAVVSPYSNERPALLEKVLGKGRVLTMTTSVSESATVRADDRWNLLPTGFEPWPFLMLMNEMTLYLVGTSDGHLNYATGQSAVLRLDPHQRYATYSTSTPRGDHVRQAAEPKQDAIIFTDTGTPGNYRIDAGGQDSGVHLGFSVNLPLESTQLDRADPEQLKQLFGEIPYRVAHTRDQIDREVAKSRVGHELFPLLIGLVAVVLGVEQLLASRFYREHK